MKYATLSKRDNRNGLIAFVFGALFTFFITSMGVAGMIDEMTKKIKIGIFIFYLFLTFWFVVLLIGLIYFVLNASIKEGTTKRQRILFIILPPLSFVLPALAQYLMGIAKFDAPASLCCYGFAVATTVICQFIFLRKRRHISPKLTLLIIGLMLCNICEAKYTQTCKVEYRTKYGWSDYYTVGVHFYSGHELNKATKTYDYTTYSIYGVVFWGEGKATVIEIGDYTGCSMEVDQSCITRSYGNLEGEDQEGRKWAICVKSPCY